MTDTITDLLELYRSAGVLDSLDVSFARTLARLAGVRDDNVLLAAALASRAPAYGHVCADLLTLQDVVRAAADAHAADPDNVPSLDALPWPRPSVLQSALAKSPLVRMPEDETARPLVLSGTRLYLDRLWRDERSLAAQLHDRLACVDSLDEEQTTHLRAILDRLFRRPEGAPPAHEQMLAVAVAAVRRFAVITGGPGTGKTSTVVRLLALLREHAGKALCVALLAPTGKAAARLSEAVQSQRSELNTPLQADLPAEASTIHRALGTRPGSPGRFRHDADNPLPVDVVVVDEASMVDLSLMARLFEAVPPQARVILLGDRDQLASVEAGAVLGDICHAALQVGGFSPAFAARLQRIVDVPPERIAAAGGTAIQDAVVPLTRSYRFRREEGIGRLADAIKQGAAGEALRCLREDRAQLRLIASRPGARLPREVRRMVADAYRSIVSADSAPAALKALQGFRVLCAHRRGPRGVRQINPRIEEWLREQGLIADGRDSYGGCPFMIGKNDYPLQLFNGDVGVLREDGGRLFGYFPELRGSGVRKFALSRLPPHETVYAMTIHKSQGSEFDRVVILLPDRPSRILTRELLYTAVTRARQHVTIVGSEDVVRAAIDERIERVTGTFG